MLGPTVAKACDDSCGPVREAALKILAVTKVVLGEATITNFTSKARVPFGRRGFPLYV